MFACFKNVLTENDSCELVLSIYIVFILKLIESCDPSKLKSNTWYFSPKYLSYFPLHILLVFVYKMTYNFPLHVTNFCSLYREGFLGVISQLEERQFYLGVGTSYCSSANWLENAISLEPLPCYLHVNVYK